MQNARFFGSIARRGVCISRVGVCISVCVGFYSERAFCEVKVEANSGAF